MAREVPGFVPLLSLWCWALWSNPRDGDLNPFGPSFGFPLTGRWLFDRSDFSLLSSFLDPFCLHEQQGRAMCQESDSRQ